MDTDGLAVFGLSEVELVMEQKLLKKNKKLNLMELIWNLRGWHQPAFLLGKTDIPPP